MVRLCLPALFRDDKQSITCPFHRVSKNNIGEQTGVDWLLNRHRSAPSLPVGVIKLMPKVSFEGDLEVEALSPTGERVWVWGRVVGRALWRWTKRIVS